MDGAGYSMLDIYEEFGDDPGYDLTHSFTFTGMAIKNLGA